MVSDTVVIASSGELWSFQSHSTNISNIAHNNDHAQSRLIDVSSGKIGLVQGGAIIRADGETAASISVTL